MYGGFENVGTFIVYRSGKNRDNEENIRNCMKSIDMKKSVLYNQNRSSEGNLFV